MQKLNKMDYDVGYSLGAFACRKGFNKIPAHDKNLMGVIKGKGGEVGSSISLLKGWHDGYQFELNKNIRPKLQQIFNDYER